MLTTILCSVAGLLTIGSIAGGIYVYRFYTALKEDEKALTEDFSKVADDLEYDYTTKMAELTDMNSVEFECPCRHNVVKTFIDLSNPENTFMCPECKNTYKVLISMEPVLKGKIVDESNLYNLLQEKANNQN